MIRKVKSLRGVAVSARVLQRVRVDLRRRSKEIAIRLLATVRAAYQDWRVSVLNLSVGTPHAAQHLSSLKLLVIHLVVFECVLFIQIVYPVEDLCIILKSRNDVSIRWRQPIKAARYSVLVLRILIELKCLNTR